MTHEEKRAEILRDIKDLSTRAQSIIERIHDFHGDGHAIDMYRLSMVFPTAGNMRAVIAAMTEAVECRLVPRTNEAPHEEEP